MRDPAACTCFSYPRRAPALYLCWTRTLAAAMRADGLPNAWAVREYAAKLLADAGMTIQDGAPPDAWSTDTWNNVALAAAIDAVPRERAHAIVVVDEAQDFTDKDCELAKALAGEGPLWDFGDEGQSFWEDRGIPKGLFGGEMTLKARCRCPELLAAFADRYRRDSKDKGAPARLTELRLAHVGAQEKLTDRVRLEVQRALEDGARPEDIAVLSLKGQTKSELLRDKRLGDIPIARADAKEAEQRVVVDTFLRFKGLGRRPLLHRGVRHRRCVQTRPQAAAIHGLADSPARPWGRGPARVPLGSRAAPGGMVM